MKTETCHLIKSSPWTAQEQAIHVPKPTLQQRGPKTPWRLVLASDVCGSHTDPVVQHLKENNCANQ